MKKIGFHSPLDEVDTKVRPYKNSLTRALSRRKREFGR